ncbi:MAG: right-handed parallel beta-helix repeat-containing protein [Victivallaceae bacterium]|nr:right-handed parallel beta-helix repeat-containing protein [Victivallaceae bacterium]
MKMSIFNKSLKINKFNAWAAASGTAIFLLFSTTVFPQSYYVDATSGNDNNTGQSEIYPWQHVSQVNNYTSFQSGDTISFKRGEVWQEKLIIPASGITIGAYGEGDLPLFDGLTQITGWQKANSLSVDGKQIWYKLRGGEPYFVYWLCVLEQNNEHWRINSRGADLDLLEDGEFGYKSYTADCGSWAFYLRLDSGNPDIIGYKVYLSRDFDNLIDTNSQNNLVIEDIAVRGAAAAHGGTAILLNDSDYVTIQNCDIYYSTYGVRSYMSNVNILNENFDSYTAGATTIAGASFAAPAPSEISVSNTTSDSSPNSLKFTDASVTPNYRPSALWYIDSQSGGRISVSFKYRKETSGDPLFYLDMKGGSKRVGRVTVGDETVSSYNGTTVTIADNLDDQKWHDVYILINFSSKTYEVIVNNQRVNQISFWEQDCDSINFLSFYDDGQDDDVIYIDDFKVERVYFSDINNCIVQNNSIHDNIEGAIYISGYSSDNLITGNRIFDNYNLGYEDIGDRNAIGITGDLNFPGDRQNNTISYNYIYNNGNALPSDSAIAVYSATGTTVANNDIHGNLQGAFYFAFANNSEFKNNWVHHNEVNNGFHVKVHSYDNNVITDNMIFDNTVTADGIRSYGENSYRLLSTDSPASNTLFSGNTIFNNLTQTYTDYPVFLVWMAGTNPDIDETIYFNNVSLDKFGAAAPLYCEFDGSQTTYSDFAAWNFDTYSQSIDPQANASYELIDERFDFYQHGDVNISGASISANDNGKIMVSSEASSSWPYALKFIDKIETFPYRPSISWTTASQTTGKIKVSFKYMKETAGDPIFYLDMKGAGKRIGRLTFGSDSATATAYNGITTTVITNLQDKIWYNAEITIDLDQGVYHVTVDGTTVSDLNFWQSDCVSLNFLSFYDDGQVEDIIYIDDFRVVKLLPETILVEDFDTYQNNADTIEIGSFNAPAPSSITVSSDKWNSWPNSLKFIDKSLTDAYRPSAGWYITSQTSGIINVSFKYMKETAGDPLFYLDMKGAGKRVGRLTFGSDSATSYNGNSTVVTTGLLDKKWHNAEIRVDLDQGIYHITVDGTTVSNFSFWEQDCVSLNFLSFYDDGQADDIVYIDDLIITKE